MGREQQLRFGPQVGPQTACLSSPADIRVFGGAAGGGKSIAGILDPARYLNVPGFRGIAFRKNTTDARNPGGLWDESKIYYPYLDGDPNDQRMEWRFPSGAWLKLSYLDHDNDVYNHRSAQYGWMWFEEATDFSEFQTWYLIGRLRSATGIRPSALLTCNPDPDSWLARFIDWWLVDEGTPDWSKSGVIRWFIRVDGEFLWADTLPELVRAHPRHFDVRGPDGRRVHPRHLAMSATFIPSKLEDNPALLEKDPSYRAKIAALDPVSRARMGGGNWKIREAAGLMFKRDSFPIVDAPPQGPGILRCRYWDLAATEAKPGTDPDYTVGLLLAASLPEAGAGRGLYWIEDVVRGRWRPHEVEAQVRAAAELDGKEVPVWIEQEPGSSGVNTIDNYQRTVLPGWEVRGNKPTGSKVTRARTASAAADAGNIHLVRAPWNRPFLSELEGFPDAAHDDQVDALSGAFEKVREGGFAVA